MVDIPNQKGSIKKEDLQSKIKNQFKKVKISNSIEESIASNSNSSNQIILIAGSTYLAGEVLKLN